MRFGGYNQATSHKPQATSHKPQATSHNYALIAERKNTETNALMFGRINPEREGDFLCRKETYIHGQKTFSVFIVGSVMVFLCVR